ncbi:CPBP family intramembrane glutamic endopeptidase [Corallococcus llansteffanensis]|uniref:CPBP family intramembrane metalloprotease n=1 Tax=Corallococcus llansteffanensis TaxID=2316731 RepID=A0A3A8PBJ6_9BACT|nr:type II CAAX endopeptidase family protein [Corallococcus llansteffanensis]RKH53339.1 CPBP family intramembrane metalloprotease [Corallococcus llansteffanensis]
MDSQPERSNAQDAMPSATAKRPRVWTVALAFVLMLVTLLTVGALLAGIAMAMEMSRTGVKAQDTAALTAMMEQIKLLPWLHVAGVMTSSLTGLCVALLGGWLSPRPLRERLRLTTGASLPVWAWGAALVGCFALGQALESLSVLTGVWDWTSSLKGLQATSQGSFGTFVMLMFFGTLVAGTAEELFFRGYVQTRLVERWGRWGGIAGAATLFGFIHLDPIHSPLALVLGLYLGWLAERTGSVRLPVFVHILNNAASFLLTRFALSATELATSVHLALLVGCSLLALGAVVLLLRRTGTSSVEGARPALAGS